MHLQDRQRGNTRLLQHRSRGRFARGGLGRHCRQDTVPAPRIPKVLSGTSIRILAASRYIFAVQRASYSICSTPKAPEQSPCSHVLAYTYVPRLNSLYPRVRVPTRACPRVLVGETTRRMLVSVHRL